MDFPQFGRRLQALGLTVYEARVYLVLVGNSRCKALDVAARAEVPRQKIYEVLDSLADKGLVEVVQDRTKLFSAIEPGLALANYLTRRSQLMQQQWVEQSRLAGALVEDLSAAVARMQDGKGTLDYVHIVVDPGQAADHYRRMMSEVRSEYIEFLRPPYAVNPLDSDLVMIAQQRGVRCRILVDSSAHDETWRERRERFGAAGVEVCAAPSLPMKLAVFDSEQGLIALQDRSVAQPMWTSLLFTHDGLGQAMHALFEEHWHRATAAAQYA